jgi:hypothetical protein
VYFYLPVLLVSQAVVQEGKPLDEEVYHHQAGDDDQNWENDLGEKERGSHVHRKEYSYLVLLTSGVERSMYASSREAMKAIALNRKMSSLHVLGRTMGAIRMTIKELHK